MGRGRVIALGNQRPLNMQASGTVPDVSGAMQDYFQPLQVTSITKGSLGFQVIETGVVTEFRGVVQPLSGRKLELKPEGQRAWTWLTVHTDRPLPIEVDDVMTFRGKATRVMLKKDFGDYGFFYFECVQDWTGSAPRT